MTFAAEVNDTIQSHVCCFLKCEAQMDVMDVSSAGDIDRVADFVEQGARLVVKLADEIEAMAHIAELTAQEAEDLALKVEAKTKIVKQTLDAIADVLEGDKTLSTVLTDYATQKKAAAGTETPTIS